jgi:hypothetical protein
MLQTETSRSRKNIFDAYMAGNESKYIINKELEWLIEEGNIRESIYFKGETGDRYTIYIASRRNRSIIDFTTVTNSYSHGTELGNHIATLRGYVLTMHGSGYTWNEEAGLASTFKQLMRQGVMSKAHPWTIKFCRSAYMVKLSNVSSIYGINVREFTPFKGMQIDLRSGILLNKPTKLAVNSYREAKERDRVQKKRNYIANKNNREALARYRKAGGDTEQARGWNAEPGFGVAQINWDMIPIDDVFKHRNATLRSNILEHFGMNALLKTLKYDVVDIDFIDSREYKLLNVEIPDNSTGTDNSYQGLYLQMLNPSTGESHFEGIANVGNWNAPKEATVKEALAWRDGDRDTQKMHGYADRDTKSVYVVPVKLT